MRNQSIIETRDISAERVDAIMRESRRLRSEYMADLVTRATAALNRAFTRLGRSSAPVTGNLRSA